jgi:hypothetical protein
MRLSLLLAKIVVLFFAVSATALPKRNRFITPIYPVGSGIRITKLHQDG